MDFTATVLALLYFTLSSSRNINRTRRGDVYVLVEPNLMNARLHESVNDKAAFAVSSFSSRRRNVFRRDAGKISRPRFSRRSSFPDSTGIAFRRRLG